VKIDILSLFPEFIEAFFQQSIIKRAIEAGLVDMSVTNPRDYTKKKHRQVDDTIYGGDPGMLMMCQPLFDACHAVLPEKGPRDRVILLSPAGETLTQDKVKELYHSYDHLVLICGHYEGVDHRVEDHLADELISIGDYVITGGELGAMVISDAVSRMIPGVLGDAGSAASDSFYEPILEYPQYTKPAEYNGWKVPDVLLSGHHANIARWRRKEALRRTFLNRPDLLKKLNMTDEDRKLLKEVAEEEAK
jgi:tRNA (guanine37-N1)-methyltransferase